VVRNHVDRRIAVTNGLIWVGTSDASAMTRNDGGTRGRTTRRRFGAGGRGRLRQPRPRVVTRAGARTSRRRLPFDDFKPYLYTTRFRRDWTIDPAICRTSRSTVFEDAKNPELLFVGNDTGVFVSIDRGGRWVKMNNNMPNIPVHDLAVHPREQESEFSGTYARDFWITTQRLSRELTPALLECRRASLPRENRRHNASTLGVRVPTTYLFGSAAPVTPNIVQRHGLSGTTESCVTWRRGRVVITDAAGVEVARVCSRRAGAPHHTG
jgi:hypothetical protein